MNKLQKNELKELKKLLIENNLTRHGRNRLILFIEKLEQQLQQKEDIINKAKEYVINHLKQDMLSDFTGANYIQEYIEEPDGLLEILNIDKGDD